MISFLPITMMHQLKEINLYNLKYFKTKCRCHETVLRQVLRFGLKLKLFSNDLKSRFESFESFGNELLSIIISS